MLKRYLPILCAISLSCGEPDPTSVSLQVYPAEGAMHDNVLVDNSASFMELLLTGGPRPFVERFSLTGSSGRLTDLPLGTGYQLTARGYQMNADGSSSLVFYGGTSRFDVTGDGLPPLSIQVGRANCVAYNRPSIYRSLIGKADLVDKRVGFAVTKLPDGRVLITGGAELDANGNIQSISDTVELYDPVQGQFISLLDASGIPVRMSQPRAFHTAVALTDGSVLLAGGQLTAAGDLSNSVSMFFPNGPIFEGPVSAPDFIARKSHRARRLNDGSVLLAGGLDLNGQPLASTYRYFPADQSFRPQGDMATARSGHSLNDIERGGELALVAGGYNGNGVQRTIEIFTTNANQAGCFGGLTPSATTGCWISLGTALELPTPVWGHSAVTVNNGSEVVVVGGYTSSDRTQVSQEVTVIPSSLSGTQSAGTLGVGGGDLAVAVTSNGQSPELVVAGGRQGDTPQQRFVRLVRSQVSDVVQYQQQELAPGCVQQGFPEARYGAEAIALDNQTVLVIGGANRSVNGFSSTRRAELFFPANVPAGL
ncbi:MAG: hypothetical protein ACON3Z_09085 [Bradymonadia bacterium]